MADEQQVPPASTEPAPTQSAPSIDPAEYEALQNEVRQSRQAFAMLDPHSDRIRRLLEDPNAAQLFDRSISAYETMERERAPRVPDEMQPMFEKVSKLESFVDKYEAAQKAEAERPQREYQQHYLEWQNAPSNNRFYQRLIVDHSDLQPRDIQYLAQVAAEKNFEPLEETWKREGWRFVKAGEATPPSSLRTDAGEVGIPGDSQRGAQGNMRDRIVQLEKARRGIA